MQAHAIPTLEDRRALARAEGEGMVSERAKVSTAKPHPVHPVPERPHTDTAPVLGAYLRDSNFRRPILMLWIGTSLVALAWFIFSAL